MTVRAHRRRLLYTAAAVLRRRESAHQALVTGLALCALCAIAAVVLVLRSAPLRSRLSTCCVVLASEAWYLWRTWDSRAAAEVCYSRDGLVACRSLPCIRIVGPARSLSARNGVRSSGRARSAARVCRTGSAAEVCHSRDGRVARELVPFIRRVSSARSLQRAVRAAVAVCAAHSTHVLYRLCAHVPPSLPPPRHRCNKTCGCAEAAGAESLACTAAPCAELPYGPSSWM